MLNNVLSRLVGGEKIAACVRCVGGFRYCGHARTQSSGALHFVSPNEKRPHLAGERVAHLLSAGAIPILLLAQDPSKLSMSLSSFLRRRSNRLVVPFISRKMSVISWAISSGDRRRRARSGTLSFLCASVSLMLSSIAYPEGRETLSECRLVHNREINQDSDFYALASASSCVPFCSQPAKKESMCFLRVQASIPQNDSAKSRVCESSLSSKGEKRNFRWLRNPSGVLRSYF